MRKTSNDYDLSRFLYGKSTILTHFETFYKPLLSIQIEVRVIGCAGRENREEVHAKFRKGELGRDVVQDILQRIRWPEVLVVDLENKNRVYPDVSNVNTQLRYNNF